jgi:hypothetical protein
VVVFKDKELSFTSKPSPECSPPKNPEIDSKSLKIIARSYQYVVDE